MLTVTSHTDKISPLVKEMPVYKVKCNQDFVKDAITRKVRTFDTQDAAQEFISRWSRTLIACDKRVPNFRVVPA